MKLLDGGRAPNPRRTRIFLAEKGVKVDIVPVDIARREHLEGEVAALNPMRRLPVLVLDDGTPISESIAICRYFEALQPDPPLFGRGALGIAMVEMWNRRIEMNLSGVVAAAFRHSHPSMAELEVPQVPQWAEANRNKIVPMLQLLDRELADRRHIAGDGYSVADISALCAVDFLRVLKIDVPEELGNLRRWHEEVASRPSAKA